MINWNTALLSAPINPPMVPAVTRKLRMHGLPPSDMGFNRQALESPDGFLQEISTCVFKIGAARL
jgi:hypothetical protein